MKTDDVKLIAHFDELPEKYREKLTDFDERVYVAIAGLYSAGKKTMDCRMIYQAMGIEEPNDGDLWALYESVLKMQRIWITLRHDLSGDEYALHENHLLSAAIACAWVGEHGKEDVLKGIDIMPHSMPILITRDSLDWKVV